MPQLTVFAGPNGSGKSTLTRQAMRQGIALGEYLNADDIALTLEGDPAERAAAAQQRVRNLRAAALAEGRSHCFETVMSHPSHIDHMIAARLAGFTVNLLFVATADPAINVGRVRSRVLNGGHAVPEDRIVQRYYRTLALAPSAIKASNFADIFDNSAQGQMVLIASVSDGFLSSMVEPLPDWFAPIADQLRKPDIAGV